MGIAEEEEEEEEEDDDMEVEEVEEFAPVLAGEEVVEEGHEEGKGNPNSGPHLLPPVTLKVPPMRMGRSEDGKTE